MSDDLNQRLVAVGATLKAKGWESASIDIFVSYLAIFDREPSPLDPMISYRPSIRASLRDKFDIPSTHEFVRDSWGEKTLDEAIAKLEAAAEAMPTSVEEAARMEIAKKKLGENLSADERRLLGIRV